MSHKSFRRFSLGMPKSSRSLSWTWARWENSSAPSSSKPTMKASGTLALIQARSFDLSLSGPTELLSILSSTWCDITQRQLNETMVWFAYQKDARTVTHHQLSQRVRPWFELSSPCAKIRCDRCSLKALLGWLPAGNWILRGALWLVKVKEGGEVDYHDARFYSYGFWKSILIADSSLPPCNYPEWCPKIYTR